MSRHHNAPARTLEDVIGTDGWARAMARELMGAGSAEARALMDTADAIIGNGAVAETRSRRPRRISPMLTRGADALHGRITKTSPSHRG